MPSGGRRRAASEWDRRPGPPDRRTVDGAHVLMSRVSLCTAPRRDLKRHFVAYAWYGPMSMGQRQPALGTAAETEDCLKKSEGSSRFANARAGSSDRFQRAAPACVACALGGGTRAAMQGVGSCPGHGPELFIVDEARLVELGV